MSRDTDIQWTDSTVNPTMGCDGCELWKPGVGGPCYAGNLHVRYGGTNKGFSPKFEILTEYAGRTEKAAAWSDLTGTERPDKPWANGMPRMIFVSDMSDALSTAVSFDFLKREIIDVATSPKGRRHVWQWLTKRPARMGNFGLWLLERGSDFPSNLWAGTSITGPSSLARLDGLWEVPSPRRFLSIEPLWAPVTLGDRIREVHWVIVGGSSGKDAREFNVEWARSIIAECRAAKVPVFVKQLGANVVDGDRGRLKLRDGHGGDWSEWPEDLRVREFPVPIGAPVPA